MLYCLPQVSAYIGADIVAGAYVCGLKNERGNVLFIDTEPMGRLYLPAAGGFYAVPARRGRRLRV